MYIHIFTYILYISVTQQHDKASCLAEVQTNHSFTSYSLTTEMLSTYSMSTLKA